VRGETERETRELARSLDRLSDEILRLLPYSRLESVEVWLQDQPRLYSFPAQKRTDAEGLYSAAHDRILLSRDADDVERTLAHELCHAALGPTWSTLPGSLEEGLCDVVSTLLVPEGAARLRAGRLASAALACGGLRLEVGLSDANGSNEWTRRLLLSGADLEDQHLDVFTVEAGLTSSPVDAREKRSYYGLAFFIVERIVDRHGISGLAELCSEARRRGHAEVPRDILLAAAGLGHSVFEWKRAAAASFGASELNELVKMYPELVSRELMHELEERREERESTRELLERHQLWARSTEAHIAERFDLRPVVASRTTTAYGTAVSAVYSFDQVQTPR